jgi:hypothetical protein
MESKCCAKYKIHDKFKRILRRRYDMSTEFCYLTTLAQMQNKNQALVFQTRLPVNNKHLKIEMPFSTKIFNTKNK